MGECFGWLEFVDAFISLFAQAPIKRLWIRVAVGPQHGCRVVAQQLVACKPWRCMVVSAVVSYSTTAEQADARQSVAMDFLQRASAANRCLLAMPSAQWGNSALCPGADPQHLQAGLSDALAWQLISWQPQDFASGTLQWRWPDGFARPACVGAAAMTLTEVVVSAAILGISTQVGLQGWASTAKASASAVLIDQQHQRLEQRLLASRRLLQASGSGGCCLSL